MTVLEPGELLEGRYRVVRTLMAGGMGALYEAVDTRLADSPCAVKVMLNHDADSRQYIEERFQEEMKVLARLNHPGIPRVRDFFSRQGVNYIVMDLVNGRNLAEVLKSRLARTEKPLQGDEVIQIALQVLEVLEYLHGHNPPIVHRDIKPANLIEEQGSRIKLVDFGIACDQSDSTRTQVGTMGYCPLEQMQGKAVTQSDLYALGATMHHLLTGVAPLPMSFESLARSRPDLAPPLVMAVNRAISQRPADRFANAAQFATSLRAALGSTERLALPGDEDGTILFSSSLTEAAPTNPAPPTAVGGMNPWVMPLAATCVVFLMGMALLRGHSEPVVSTPTPTVVSSAAPPAPATPKAVPTPPPSHSSMASRPAEPVPVVRHDPPPPVRTAPTPAPAPAHPAARVPSLGGETAYPKAATRIPRAATPTPELPPFPVAEARPTPPPIPQYVETPPMPGPPPQGRYHLPPVPPDFVPGDGRPGHPPPYPGWSPGMPMTRPE